MSKTHLFRSLTTTTLALAIFVLLGRSVYAQLLCAPNSLPRTCSGAQVCTISGNCGLLQNIACCVSSSGFPTNTPTPLVTSIPIPTDLPTFPPPTHTPIPTPTIYVGSLTPWYTQDLSSSRELIMKVVSDSTNTYLYLIGRSHINENGGGWTEGSIGFVRKIRKSDKSTIWSKTIGNYLGYFVGGMHDVEEDGSGLYVSGYTEWGSKLYTAKLNNTDGSVVWERTDSVGPSDDWTINRGLGLSIDANYIFIAGSDTIKTGQNFTRRWSVIRKRKTDGITEVSRIVDLTGGEDVARDLVLSGAYVLVVGDANGVWRMEKLNKSDLSLVTSKTSVSGRVSPHSAATDGTYLFFAGHEARANGGGSIRAERHRVSNLNLNWGRTETDRGTLQSNARTLLSGSSLIVVGNNEYHTIDNTWQDAQVLYLTTASGAVTKNVTYTGVGYVGGLSVDASSNMYLAGSLNGDSDGAVYLLNQVNYTPTPTPTIPTVAGCNSVSWSSPNNVVLSGNSLVGTTYTSWNFENGANSSVTATKGTSLGGYTEIPQTNPNYAAMWGISANTAYTGWIDYSWYAPYYSGNEIYIMLPGRSAISMGSANPGDRFGVQLGNSTIAFVKALSGSNTWQIMYMTGELSDDIINNTTQFRARVAGYSQILRAYSGTSCQMATVPSLTPIPTGPVGGYLTPWYSYNTSSYPEISTQVASDPSGQFVYLTGKANIGAPWGWFQSGNGFIQKIRKSDKQVVWQRSVESSWGIFGNSAVYDVKPDTNAVYISGYTWWGTKLYTAKLDASNGSVIWSTEDNTGWSWFPYAGQSLAMDDNYLYVAKNSTSNDFKTDFSIVKKSKSNGSIVASRTVDLSDDWNAVTNVLVLNGFVYVSGYKAYNNPYWYVEKLNANDLSLVTSATGANGVVDMHGMVTDGTYLYLGGFEKTAGTSMYSSSLRTRIHVEKRRLSDLSSIWIYNFPLTYYWQGSSAISLFNNEVLVSANDQMDRAGWFGSSWVGQNLRFIRLSQVTGNMVTTMAYGGVANTGGMAISPDQDILLAAATTNRAESAIFRLNDLIAPQANFGLKVTQTLLTNPVVKGGPIQIRVDIENASNATEAAWAFSFSDSVPSTILGVLWDCSVAQTGIPAGDMSAFPARCGAVHSGTGNNIFFSHSSSADPLIHPGGKLSITMNGVVAPNAPPSITNVASISSYPGWTNNHYYTVNFISSPANYTTLPDNDPSDNTSTLTIPVVVQSTPTSIPGSPTPTLTPSLTPTPTRPMPYIPSCVAQDQILRATIDGRDQYYCEDNDPTGHNFIMVRDGVVEKLNSSETTVEDVAFVHQPSTNGVELVTVTFTVRARNLQGVAGGILRSKTYSITIRMQ